MHLVKSLFVVALATPLVVAGPRGNGLRRRAGDDDDSSSLSTTDLTPSSSESANDQPSVILIGTAPLGTGISSAPGTTQAVVITDVVYTTLTTCPVTSLVTSGSTSFEEITTTISTVTRTSTSTLCTKCVAPPSKPALSSSSPRETAATSLPSSIIYSLSQPSSSLPSILRSSTAEVPGTGVLSAILFTNTIPVIPLQTAISSKPEVPNTATSPSKSPVFPSFVSLTVSAASSVSSTLEFPGYGIVPSPTSTPGLPREEIFSNATSSIIPVYTAALLGNAYGGGFVSTPSVYVTRLPYPNSPSSGVPPGYGSGSSTTITENNVTAVFPSLEAFSTSAAGLQSTTEIAISAFTATIASNVSVLIGTLGASTIAATTSGNEGSTPTFISLSPFGGEVGQESGSPAIPTVVSIEVPSSPGSAIVGTEANVASTATTPVQRGNSGSGGVIGYTAIIAATSPAGALNAEVNQVSNAVLSSLTAAGVPTSSLNVQVAVVGSSTTSIIGSSGETAESSFPTSTLIGGAAILSTVATVSPLGAGPSSFQVIAAAENATSSTTSVIELAGAIGSSVVPATTSASVILSPNFSSSGINIEATPAGNLTSGEIGATIIPSLPAEQSAGPVVTLAVGSSAEQTPAAGQSATLMPTPIIVANGSTALAVVPSPVVGANGLTSLAVFSTPIAPAAGVTTPAVLLTPIVGANGLTSLAVVATPVVGANGLTSLAIGFETETIPTAGQSNSAPTPIEGFVVVQPPAFTPQVSGSIPNQANIAASGVVNVVLPSGSAESPVSGDSGSGNYSIHVLLNPTAASQFQGSAVRISLGFGVVTGARGENMG
ncbi:hypothetical protein HO133_004982 [Letharia lupina]|uniref:Uncharacterized protein n=1 Tax=Letharia lupina TaxID=560253 RepID=A0A8H6F8G8_9LECA|nr:uncharacterized protein HO133_004982 [Letharia lupina]KAF6219157.1 hypothetical protein HO133_004982 [Letharia lupina]